MDGLRDRTLGCLCAAGIGDALGAQTEGWAIDEIEARHGGFVRSFDAPPPDTYAGAQGGKRAEVTDDASQLYHLARALADIGPGFGNADWVRCLLDWADTSDKAGCMGPSTWACVQALREGRDPLRTGMIGTSQRRMASIGITNGAAMRVAPCGLMHPGRIEAACELALLTCLPSHDTDVAVASACCIAAGVARALTNPAPAAVVEACREGAAYGERLGRERARHVPGARLPVRLDLALAIAARGLDDPAFLRELAQSVGTSVLAVESVPAAVAVFAQAKGEPLRTLMLAASIGNDSDTIATMAGALAGAACGAALLPAELMAEFLAVNEPVYGLHALAEGLARRVCP